MKSNEAVQNIDKNKGLEEYIDINFLNPKELKFSKTKGDLITLKFKDKTYKRVDFFKVFPLSINDQYISVREHEGEEIGIIKDLNIGLNNKAKAIINKHLNNRYFTPEIVKINKLTEEFGYDYWTVETTSGKKDFITKRRNNNLKVLQNNNLLISDMDGNRYEIKNRDIISDKQYRIIENLI